MLNNSLSLHEFVKFVIKKVFCGSESVEIELLDEF